MLSLCQEHALSLASNSPFTSGAPGCAAGSRFFVTPSDSVAVIAAHAQECIPYFSSGLKVTLPGLCAHLWARCTQHTDSWEPSLAIERLQTSPPGSAAMPPLSWPGHCQKFDMPAASNIIPAHD